jgi:hypothetical protein
VFQRFFFGGADIIKHHEKSWKIMENHGTSSNIIRYHQTSNIKHQSMSAIQIEARRWRPPPRRGRKLSDSDGFLMQRTKIGLKRNLLPR